MKQICHIPIVWLLLLIACLLSQGITTAHAQTILGQSCAMSGPTSFLGQEMNRGAKAYFDKYAANDVVLKVLDDKYEPEKCILNTEKLMGEKVAALFAYVGTPTAKVAVPLAMKQKTVFFGAFTGAGFLGDPKTNPFSFSVRASYDAEIENMVRRLKEDLNVSKISLFVQRDAFGLTGLRGAVKAVGKIAGVEIIPAIPEIPKNSDSKDKWNAFWNAVPNYRRNSIAVGRDARKISGNKDIQAVILVGAYRPCAAAINLWKKIDFDAIFINISFVGSNALAESLGGNTKNVLISQVVPDPWDKSLPLVREYQEAMGDKYGFVSLEGYISAKIIHKAIKNAGSSVNSESLREKLETMSSYDIGGLNVSFAPDDHRGLDQVYLTRIEKEKKGKSFKFKYVDRIEKE